MNNSTSRHILMVSALVFWLSACSGLGGQKTSADEGNESAESVENRFQPKGHLNSRPPLETVVPSPAVIPDLVTDEAINVNPSEMVDIKRYSVSAIKVPAAELLFNLAKTAGMQLDLSASVSGRVTINAIDQPLEQILQRVAQQLDVLYEVDGDVITVKPDTPFWKSYEVDYVNVTKRIQDTTVMKMSVGNTLEGFNMNRGNQSSEFKLDTTAVSDFWVTLEENVSAMAKLEIKPVKTVSQLRSFDDDRQRAGQNLPEAEWRMQAYTEGVETRSRETLVSTTSEEVDNVVVNKEAGLLTVYTNQRQHQQIARYLRDTLNRTHKQVLIEATVVEVALNDQHQAGVDWSAVTSSGSGSASITQSMLGKNLSTDPNFSINLASLGAWDFSLGIKLLQQFGDTKVLSSPKIMAMNNQTALLK
ncbi:MAG: hypothetical protein ACP5D0_08295, partial [Hydrogenovibrio sp.]